MKKRRLNDYAGDLIYLLYAGAGIAIGGIIILIIKKILNNRTIERIKSGQFTEKMFVEDFRRLMLGDMERFNFSDPNENEKVALARKQLMKAKTIKDLIEIFPHIKPLRDVQSQFEMYSPSKRIDSEPAIQAIRLKRYIDNAVRRAVRKRFRDADLGSFDRRFL